MGKVDSNGLDLFRYVAIDVQLGQASDGLLLGLDGPLSGNDVLLDEGDDDTLVCSFDGGTNSFLVTHLKIIQNITHLPDN